jgi:hypothetical protein
MRFGPWVAMESSDKPWSEAIADENMLEQEKKIPGGRDMSLTYDIFERMPDGQPLWVKAVASLEEARMQIVALGRSRGRTARDFFVYDVRRGAEIATQEI